VFANVGGDIMIIYGKKRRPQISELSEEIQCPHCLQNVPILVVGCVEYFHLFYIPFFGWKSTVYLCSDCEKTLKAGIGRYQGDLAVAIPREAAAISEKIKPQVRIPWYYFVGSLLLAGALLLLAVSS